MKTLRIASLGVLVASVSILAAEPPYPGNLRPPLAEVLDRAPSGELVPVSIVLKEQVAPGRLSATAAGLDRREARPQRTAVLKEIARRTQVPLLAQLHDLEGRGIAKRIRPLWIGNVVGVDATPAAIRAIAARPEVAWVNYNPKVAVFGDAFTPAPAPKLELPAPTRPMQPNEIECGVNQMRAPEVWSSLGNTGQGALIAMIDTGVCWTHSDIVNQVWVNPGEDLNHNGVVMDAADINGLDDDTNGFVDDLIGWNFDFNNNQPNDDNSHGSHTAGTVAGDGTAGTQSGMAPDAKVMVLRVGVSFSDEVDVWSAMQYAADNNADAISMSLGWPHNQNPDRTTWRQNSENTIDAGTAMVVAAGNEGFGAEPDNVRTPGDVPRIITVGAVDCSNVIAGFSSRGPVTWSSVPPFNDFPYPPGLIKPDVSAPGVDTKSHSVCSGYSFNSGTSMATPHVAGAVALMLAASPGLQNDDIKQILEETAVDLGAPGKDNEYGSGRVDAFAAVQNTSTPNGRVIIREPSVSCAGLLNLQVSDSDLKGLGPVAIQLVSTTESVAEIASLTETAPNSGVFRGTIQTDGGAVAADGKLQVQDGDTVTARYVDANDGIGGTNVLKTDTAVVDCRGPIIAQVAVTNVSDVAATILWQTDEPSSSDVVWGQVKPPTSNASAGGTVTAHAVPLSGLQACTTYFFEVRSADVPGNLAADNNGGQYYHFETYGDFGGGLQPCHAGRVTVLDPIVSCADSIPIRVVDLDLNLNALVPDTAQVLVSSSTEPAPEMLVLTESGPNTSQFVGSIATASGAPVPGDGILQLADGDVISASYHDTNDGNGSTAVSFDSSDADCAGPGVSSVRVTDLTDDSATVRWNTSEPSDSKVEWGTSPALGNTTIVAGLVTSHAVTIQPLAECGRFYFRVTSVDAYGNVRVFSNAGAPFEFNAYVIPGIFRDNFDGASGWTLEGDWQIGAPQAKGTPPDPASAYTSPNVLGQDLTGLGANPGNYEKGTNFRASSPVINAASLVGGQLKFRRWLNAASGAVAYVEVRKNGTWNVVWNSTAAGVSENSWSLQSVPIGAFADGNGSLQIGFRTFIPSFAGTTASSWNVDRLVVKGGSQPDFDVCGSCGGAPTFAGVLSAADVSGCADTGVQLGWNEAPAWGTGRAGTYAVYRSTDPAFVPSASNRIAAGVAALSYTDLSAPNDQNLYYIVRAENDETCSSGPNNGGVTDANLLRVLVRDETTQPAPGSVGDSVRVTSINAAQLRLTWTASPTAVRYHVDRADGPQGPWTRVGDVTGTLFEDRDEMGNLNRRYYVVKTVDSCGNEGP